MILYPLNDFLSITAFLVLFDVSFFLFFYCQSNTQHHKRNECRIHCKVNWMIRYNRQYQCKCNMQQCSYNDTNASYEVKWMESLHLMIIFSWTILKQWNKTNMSLFYTVKWLIVFLITMHCNKKFTRDNYLRFDVNMRNIFSFIVIVP